MIQQDFKPSSHNYVQRLHRSTHKAQDALFWMEENLRKILKRAASFG